MNHGLKTLLLALALALCASSPSRAQEEIDYDEIPRQWYQKPGRNNVVHAKDLPDHLGDDNRLWHRKLHGKRFFNIITIDGDRVYCGMQALNLPDRIKDPRANALLCLDLNTGETIWQKQLGEGGGWGLTGVPLIDGDFIYQQSTTDAFCVNKHTGEVIWHTNIEQRYKKGLHGTHSTGVLVGDYWYLATGHASGTDDPDNWISNALEHPFHPNIVVLEKETGKLVARDDIPINAGQHGSWCALSTAEVDGRQLVFWGDNHGYVHAWEAPEKFECDGVATLERVWHCDANPHHYRYMEDGKLQPYNIYKSNFGPCEIIAVPVYHDGLLYVALGRDVHYSPKQGKRRVGDGGIVCIDPRGEGDITETNKVWTNTDVGRTFSAPSVLDDVIIMTDHSGYVTGLDRETGETLWQGDIEAPIWNYWHVVGDGKVFIMNELRNFKIFEADRDGGLLFAAEMDGQNNPAPGLVHGRIIIGTSRSIDCYAGPGYLEMHKPDKVVESEQIRADDAVNEPVEGGH